MNMLQRLSIFLVLVVIILGCRSTQQESMRRDDGQQEQKKPADPGPGIPPNHARIVGTIVSMTSFSSANADDPCSKAPCIAVVKIESIEGFGSGFTEPVGPGKEVRVRFRYTLAPTKDLFPEMSPPMPGLKNGSRFKADLMMTGVSIAGEPLVKTFSVDRYEAK